MDDDEEDEEDEGEEVEEEEDEGSKVSAVGGLSSLYRISKCFVFPVEGSGLCHLMIKLVGVEDLQNREKGHS